MVLVMSVHITNGCFLVLNLIIFGISIISLFILISLVYNDSIKNDLLQYASSAFLFSQHKVNTSIISLNRVLLLHGPPGTGKTSLCKALAQKLAIRYYSDFSHVALIEINSHSLFSKWFSESGKLVMKLFDYINELLLDNSTMLFILIGI